MDLERVDLAVLPGSNRLLLGVFDQAPPELKGEAIYGGHTLAGLLRMSHNELWSLGYRPQGVGWTYTEDGLMRTWVTLREDES